MTRFALRTILIFGAISSSGVLAAPTLTPPSTTVEFQALQSSDPPIGDRPVVDVLKTRAFGMPDGVTSNVKTTVNQIIGVLRSFKSESQNHSIDPQAEDEANLLRVMEMRKGLNSSLSPRVDKLHQLLCRGSFKAKHAEEVKTIVNEIYEDVISTVAQFEKVSGHAVVTDTIKTTRTGGDAGLVAKAVKE
ncbi:hypothetical protein F5878DRAFT_647365 [Lentinula raphanica]|uniref:Uncharacterized protein n=1 Tax=Lentinula raphanica TaxID=153919 RepID=A0AA38U3N4_9AGAR|nr:hypothetical protein F5878DRAFT_647365 [Lentinula raphanica]